MARKATSARKAAIQQLEALSRAGVTHLPKPRRKISVRQATAETASANPASKAVAPAAKTTAATASAKSAKPAPAASVADRLAQLSVIQAEVAKCTKCDELASTRTQTVFGVGNPQARIVFMGEAPGADEDKQGEPFVGRAGQLLTKIIEACQMRREDIYILNSLKCRPPENRTPLPDEVHNCRHFFERQLDVIQPQFICCLGSVAAQSLLETDVAIGKLRGKFHKFRNLEVVCTYHPAYLLRNPSAKKDVWEDMKMLMLRLGVKL